MSQFNMLTERVSIVMDISPNMAQEMLEYNTANRPIDMPTTRMYANDMSNDDWDDNGITIKFGWNKVLLDGQKRLLAVVISGKTVRMRVEFGLDPKVFASIDQVESRKPWQVASIKGYKNTNTLMSAVRLARKILEGRDTIKQTNRKMVEWVDTHPSIAEYTDYCAGLYTSSDQLIAPSITSGLLYVFIAKNTSEDVTEEAKDFITKLVTGVNLEEGNPIVALRARLIKAKTNPYHKITREGVVRLIIATWNLCRKGKSVKMIKLPSKEKKFVVL